MNTVIILLLLYILVNGHFLPLSQQAKDTLNLLLLVLIVIALVFMLLPLFPLPRLTFPLE